MVVHPDSRRIPRVPRYSGVCLRVFIISRTGLSPSVAVPFQIRSAITPTPLLTHPTTPYLVRNMVWALPVSLAATQGISYDFSSCRYLDVSVPCVRSTCPIYSDRSDSTLLEPGCPIRKSPGLRSFASTRSLSQLTTSFVA